MPNITNINAGQAVVNVIANSKEYEDALKSAATGLQSFANVASVIGRKLQAAGTLMLAPFQEAARVFADFDARMRMVAAVTSSSGEEFDKLTEKAKQLGATTTFTAAQVAEGMGALGRMGFNPDEIDKAIKSMMDLSLATGTELAQASQIAANSMKVFNLQASDMTRIADILALTANSSAQTLDDMGEALKTAAPDAVRTGQTLEQVSAQLGILANMGIRGSMAGTALARSYKQLADPKIQKMLKDTFDISVTENGQMRDMATVFADIGKAVSALPNASQVSILEDIFNARGSLGGGTLSINAKGIEEFISKLKEAKGYAAKTSETMQSGLKGSMDAVASAFEGIYNAVGKALEGPLTAFNKWLADTSQTVIKWIDQHKILVTAIAATAAAIAALGTVLATLASAIGVFTAIKTAALLCIPALTALKTVLTACMANPAFLTLALSVAGAYAAIKLVNAGISDTAKGLNRLPLARLDKLANYREKKRKEEEAAGDPNAKAKELGRLNAEIEASTQEIGKMLGKGSNWFMRGAAEEARKQLEERRRQLLERKKILQQEIKAEQEEAQRRKTAAAEAALEQKRQKAHEAATKQAEIEKELADKKKTAIEKELEAIEAQKQGYKEAIQAQLDYEKSKAKVDGDKVKELEDRLKEADATFQGMSDTALQKHYKDSGVIDIEADRNAISQDLDKARSDFTRERTLEGIKEEQGSQAYMEELKRMFQGTAFSLEAASKEYSRLLREAKSESSEQGAEISAKEKEALDNQLETYRQLKDKLKEIQERILDGAQETERQKASLDNSPSLVGGFIAEAFSLRGNTSVENKIAKNTDSTARNTKDTLEWLKKQDFGNSFA
ncbi:MAG: phage tail tape measure protein [Victivallales bacterium]|nr:phage tail tape measure protein [Victivallales bacterium]